MSLALPCSCSRPITISSSSGRCFTVEEKIRMSSGKQEQWLTQQIFINLLHDVLENSGGTAEPEKHHIPLKHARMWCTERCLGAVTLSYWDLVVHAGQINSGNPLGVWQSIEGLHATVQVSNWPKRKRPSFLSTSTTGEVCGLVLCWITLESTKWLVLLNKLILCWRFFSSIMWWHQERESYAWFSWYTQNHHHKWKGSDHISGGENRSEPTLQSETVINLCLHFDSRQR